MAFIEKSHLAKQSLFATLCGVTAFPRFELQFEAERMVHVCLNYDVGLGSKCPLQHADCNDVPLLM